MEIYGALLLFALGCVYIVAKLLAGLFGAFTRPSKARARAEFDDDRAHSPRALKAAESIRALYPVAAQLSLKYVDATGDGTRRVITTQEFSPDPPGHVFAFCHLRKDVRTFRVDRIKEAIAVESGEVIPDVSAYLMSAYERSPIAVWSKLLDEHILALRALVYLAKADGTFSTKERDLLVVHCDQLLHRDDLTRPDMNKALRGMPETSKTAFRQICGQLRHYPAEYRGRVLATAKAMVGTQRTVAPEEAEALDYLVEKLA